MTAEHKAALAAGRESRFGGARRRVGSRGRLPSTRRPPSVTLVAWGGLSQCSGRVWLAWRARSCSLETGTA